MFTETSVNLSGSMRMEEWLVMSWLSMTMMFRSMMYGT